MALNTVQIMETAVNALAAQEQELALQRARQSLLIVCRTATDDGDIDHTFRLSRAFRVVFVRCHFAGGAGRNPLSMSIDSVAGSAFDVNLFTILRAGVGRDVNFRVTADESAEPSAWTLQAGDALRLQWINPAPGVTNWGVEVGLASGT